jgi:hypothetical protein
MPGGHGNVSPTRLILVFVVVLGIGLALGAAVMLALQPNAKKPDCPDPAVPCGQPPVQPTLPPIAQATPSPRTTPAPTIVRPSGTLVVPSVGPSVAPTSAPTVAPTPQPSGSNQPTPQPSVQPTASLPPIADLPQPRPASNADELHNGTLFQSALGFSLEYDADIWTVEQQKDSGIALSAGRGAVVVIIEGFDASGKSTKQLVQEKVQSLSDSILGLTEESDPERQLPGQPIVGHRQGDGVLLNGTIDQPQGPQANVDVVVLAATDRQITIRVTLVTTDDLRDPAFSVVDSIHNSIEWPTDQ